MTRLPESVPRWLRDHRAATVSHVTSLPSTQGRVWRVDTSEGAAWAVKRSSRAAIDRETRALALAVGSTPRLACRLDPTTVLMSWHDGGPSLDPAALTAAGAWLRCLHQVPFRDDDPVCLAQALERRARAWALRAPNELRHVLDALDPSAFEGRRRAHCHRDFTPDNWLWTPERRLTVIDFGQARPDLPLWDLVKLEGDLFRQRPELRAAFFEGYGELSPRDAEGLRQLTRLHGLQTAVWGDFHAVPELSQLGRTILAG